MPCSCIAAIFSSENPSAYLSVTYMCELLIETDRRKNIYTMNMVSGTLIRFSSFVSIAPTNSTNSIKKLGRMQHEIICVSLRTRRTDTHFEYSNTERIAGTLRLKKGVKLSTTQHKTSRLTDNDPAMALYGGHKSGKVYVCKSKVS